MSTLKPTHRCKVCGARWVLHESAQPSWQCLSPEKMGACCDNVAMGDQIEALPVAEGRVEMLPGAERPEGALSWLGEVIGNGGIEGVIVISIDENGCVDPRIFGKARRYSIAFAGAVLTDHAVNGDPEPSP